MILLVWRLGLQPNVTLYFYYLILTSLISVTSSNVSLDLSVATMIKYEWFSIRLTKLTPNRWTSVAYMFSCAIHFYAFTKTYDLSTFLFIVPVAFLTKGSVAILPAHESLWSIIVVPRESSKYPWGHARLYWVSNFIFMAVSSDLYWDVAFSRNWNKKESLCCFPLRWVLKFD